MKKQKYYLYLDSEETHIILESLNRLRNAMLREDRGCECVDEVILKIIGAPVKKVKIA